MSTKAARTKQFILETAAPIYNRKGISGASIDDVLDATKLTKGCLYGHFKGKDDLSAQVFDYMLTTTWNRMQAAIAKHDTAFDKVSAFLEFYQDPLNTPISGGCPIINGAVETDDAFPALRQRVLQIVNQAQEAFATILRAGIANGEFSAALDPAAFAFKTLATIGGALIMCRVTNNPTPMRGLIRDLKAELKAT